jgi:ABC-type metal ion transport system, periplasmic component/surface adhesin
MFSKGKKFIGIILSLIFVVVLAGCTNKKTSTSSDKLNIVTTTDFYGEVAKQVVGNKGSVTSIISNPAVDPHDFEPTTKTAQIVSKADVTVANGLGYDSWMNKLDKQDGTYIKIGEDIMEQKDW